MATRAVAIRRRPVPRAFSRAFRPRHKAKFTIPLAAVAGFAPLGMEVFNDIKAGHIDYIPYTLSAGLTGYNMVDKKWHFDNLKTGLIPIGVGLLIHKFVGGSMGVNRMLARAGVPILRI